MIHHNSAIQEGVLRDIVELLSDNVNGFVDPGDVNSSIGKLLNSRNNGKYFRSITKATSNLILTFPMIVDNSVSIETASMVSKAVEKKIVLMLQMLFSAISVTNNKDAFDFVSKIHKNLTSDDVLSYINKMDSIPYRESTTLDFDQINKDLVRLIKEDSSRELSYDLRPALEASDKRIDQRDLNMKHLKNAQKLNSADKKRMLDMQKESDRKIKELEDKIARQSFYVDTGINQPEIKKANEMVPSIMVVRFRSGEHNEAVGEAVIGVKVKLIYVNQADMIERIILKSGDQNSLFEFLKATTGEISMFKDFMFALDRAKLDIFSRSAKSSPIWKLLERRANVSRTNSFFNNNNGAGTAIATLLVSQDTMDILKKEYNFNPRNTSKLINIMTDYSAMGFIIANDVTEKVQMLFDDNDLSFETLSYSSLEREDKNQYKKVINLLAGK